VKVFWTNINQPAYLGVVNMLEAALQAPSVKKVVLCSSLAALATMDQIFGDDVSGATYTSNSRVPDSYYNTVKGQEHYFAGKTKALNATTNGPRSPYISISSTSSPPLFSAGSNLPQPPTSCWRTLTSAAWRLR
jgi:hypothetical protein